MQYVSHGFFKIETQQKLNYYDNIIFIGAPTRFYHNKTFSCDLFIWFMVFNLYFMRVKLHHRPIVVVDHSISSDEYEKILMNETV